MGEGRSMFLNVLFVIGAIAGHTVSWGAPLGSARLSGGESWLLGFGSQVDSAVEVVYRGVQNPSAISNSQLEKAIVDLGKVTEEIEGRLDKECKRQSSNRKSVEILRRKTMNARALIVFFRNLMIMEFNKPTQERNFAFAHRLGSKIRRIST